MVKPEEKVKMDVYEKIERYSDLGAGIDLANQDKQALIDSVVPQEVKDRIAEIEAEFADKIEAMSDERRTLEAEIKGEVLASGRTIKGNTHAFTFTKGRTSWDTKLLDGYAVAHPELEVARKVGEPSVSIRKV